jgi:ABC-type nitrate/sulfonate/bicarbonate transport system substrate-binding protein
VALAAAALSFTACGAGSGSSDDGGASTIRASYVPAATWLPAWVAADEGLFEAQGLDVELTPVQNLSTLPPLLGRQVDIAPATAPELFKSVGQGLDVQAVAGGTIVTAEKPAAALIGGPDATTIADLDGASIASPSVGAGMHLATLKMLDENSIPADAVQATELPFPNMPDQLKAGRVDAVETVQPFVGQLEAAGYTNLGDPFAAVGDNSVVTFWIANSEWAEKHTEDLEKWRSALAEAIEWIDANPDEAREVVAKYTQLPAEVVAQLPLPQYQASIDASQVEPWLEVMTTYGGVDDSGVDVADLVAADAS